MSECPLYVSPELYDELFSPATADAARLERLRASEAFYVAEARHGKNALEIGCGTGRLTIPIAKAGVAITGVDLSAAMLGKAREKAAADEVVIELVEGDMRDFDLGRRFETVLIPGNSLLHMLEERDVERALDAARRHLAPGGRLIFDITLSSAGEGPVRHCTTTLPGGRLVEYDLRVISPGELERYLEAAGLRLDVRYGDFDRQPFTPWSPRQLCVAGHSGRAKAT